MEKEIKRHSPKNPYRIELIFTPALKNTGSVTSFSTTGGKDIAIELANKEAAFYRACGHKGEIHIRIFHNEKTYPEFNWVKVADYYNGKAGGMRPGAGREPYDESKKRKTTSFRLLPETIRKISVLKARGVNVSRLIEKTIEEVAND